MSNQHQPLFDTSNLNLFCASNKQRHSNQVNSPIINQKMSGNEIVEVQSNSSSDQFDFQDCEEYREDKKCIKQQLDENIITNNGSSANGKNLLNDDIIKKPNTQFQKQLELLDSIKQGYSQQKFDNFDQTECQEQNRNLNLNFIINGVSENDQIANNTNNLLNLNTIHPKILDLNKQQQVSQQMPLQKQIQQQIINQQQQQQQYIQQQQSYQQQQQFLYQFQNMDINNSNQINNVYLDQFQNQNPKNFNFKSNTPRQFYIQNKNISFISNTDSTHDSDNLNSVRSLNNNNNYDPNVSFITQNTSVNDMVNSSYNTHIKSGSKQNNIYHSNRNSSNKNNNSYQNNSNTNSHNNSQNNSYQHHSRRSTIEYMDGQQLFIMQQNPTQFFNNQQMQQQFQQNIPQLIQQQMASIQNFQGQQQQQQQQPLMQQQNYQNSGNSGSSIKNLLPQTSPLYQFQGQQIKQKGQIQLQLKGNNQMTQEVQSQGQQSQQQQQNTQQQQQFEQMNNSFTSNNMNSENENLEDIDNGYQILSQSKIIQMKQKQNMTASSIIDKKNTVKNNIQNIAKNQTKEIKEYTNFEIDVDQVEQDGRTTLMIKNIPNKYNLNLLLQTIDKNHKKKYDFFYLPVDFRNKCNVGYAFLNFIDTQFIVPFFKEFNGTKWEKFFSEKICEIKYARIQGRNALVKHFQQANENKLKPLILPKADRNHIEQLLQKQRENCQQEK